MGSPTEWRKAIYDQNVLQARSPKTAKRLSVLIRGRLDKVEAPLWKLIHDGSVVEATHACLAAAIKASHLLVTSLIWSFVTNIAPSRKRFHDGYGLSTSKTAEAVIQRCRNGATQPLLACVRPYSLSQPRRATSTVPKLASSKASISSSLCCNTLNINMNSMCFAAFRWDHDCYTRKPT